MAGAGAGSFPAGPPPPPTGPGWGPPPGGHGPPAPAPTPWGKIIGIGCGILLLLLLLLGGCTALLLVAAGNGGLTPEQPGAGEPEEPPADEAVTEEVTARVTEFEPSPLYVEGDFTSVEVSVTNDGEEGIDINPLYFTVVDTDGVEHEAAIAMDENELEVQEVARGRRRPGRSPCAGTSRWTTSCSTPSTTGRWRCP
ncbi:DUF4352 domain-containing protein [Nocardiopsis sp. CNR-923]|uniref:DUF4352 domain-containing protein n=1 Tax=Nocardiopsis sp. CNR-923 TaxID=1904965 RepID=UPI0029168A7B|nr:DUF4352 domain-containing protein [Nocardiopsis sp. CNR-923]